MTRFSRYDVVFQVPGKPGNTAMPQRRFLNADIPGRSKGGSWRAVNGQLPDTLRKLAARRFPSSPYCDGRRTGCLRPNLENRYDGFMDMKLEVVAIPVADVDRAKAFYEKVGFNADHDQTVNEDLRFVQLTPPGSACSICIGKGLTQAKPGSVDLILLVIDSADKAREELLAKGIEVGEVDEQPWGRFVYLIDPDGNKLSLQELVKR